jgi:uncharacterized protein DUF6479
MTAPSAQTAEQITVAFPHVLAVVGAFFGALIVASLLVWAVQIGIRNMMREPPVPKEHEHGRLPAEGPVHESRERREPEEVPEYEKQDRLTPHEIPGFGNTSSRTSDDQKPRKWHPGTSGSFGSGGAGGR